MKEKRECYYDALRIIAIFFVIFNHTNGYMLYTMSGGVNRWIYMFITMMTRINVPLFFMISGSLLLSKSESISILLKKRGYLDLL